MKVKFETKVRIRLESFNHELLNLACNKLDNILKKNQINHNGIVSLPTKKRIYCVLRSPHVYKDSREHFEIRVHKRLIDIFYDSNNKIFELLASMDLPAGVLSKIDFK